MQFQISRFEGALAFYFVFSSEILLFCQRTQNLNSFSCVSFLSEAAKISDLRPTQIILQNLVYTNQKGLPRLFKSTIIKQILFHQHKAALNLQIDEVYHSFIQQRKIFRFVPF